MSYGVSNETPGNSDAYDTKNATILPKISISLDPPNRLSPRRRKREETCRFAKPFSMFRNDFVSCRIFAKIKALVGSDDYWKKKV